MNGNTKTEELQQRHRNFMQACKSDQSIIFINRTNKHTDAGENKSEYFYPKSRKNSIAEFPHSNFPKNSERLRTNGIQNDFVIKSAAPTVKLCIKNEDLTQREKLVRDSLRLSSAEGYQYFKGKPPLTPFSRLGCYKAQTTRRNTKRSNRCRTTTTSFSTRYESTSLHRCLSDQNSTRLLQRSKSEPQLQGVKNQFTKAKNFYFYQNVADS